MPVTRTAGALLLTAAVVVSACDGGTAEPTTSPSPVVTSTADVAGPEPSLPEPTDCPMLAGRIVDELQRYVDEFPSSTLPGESVTASPDVDLAELAERLRGLAEDLGCDRDTMAPLVADELERLTGVGALQQAVADTLRSDPLGSLDPSDRDPEVHRVTSGDELLTAVAEAGSGSTIELPDDVVEVDQPLVLLRPITISGTADSVVRSSADGAVFILAADGDAELGGFGVVHAVDRPASGIVVSAGGYRLTGLKVRGARTNDAGAGGFGVVVLPSEGGLVQGGDRAELRDVEVTDSDGGGIVIGGSAAPDLADVTVVGPDGDRLGCGICWIGTGAGNVTGATVRGWQVGLRIDEAAAPTVEDSTVEDADVGVALIGDGAPTLQRLHLVDNDTGIEAAGTGRGRLTEVEVTGTVSVGVRISAGAAPEVVDLHVDGASEAGLAVVDDAAPTIRGGELSTTGEVAAIWGGRATGSATGLAVHEARIGLQVGDRAAPTLVDLEATGVGEVAIIATTNSGGSLDGATCDEDERGSLVVVEGSTFEVHDGGNCRTVEQPADEG